MLKQHKSLFLLFMNKGTEPLLSSKERVPFSLVMVAVKKNQLINTFIISAWYTPQQDRVTALHDHNSGTLSVSIMTRKPVDTQQAAMLRADPLKGTWTHIVLIMNSHAHTLKSHEEEPTQC